MFSSSFSQIFGDLTAHFLGASTLSSLSLNLAFDVITMEIRRIHALDQMQGDQRSNNDLAVIIETAHVDHG
jgi:hypothetical protein